MSSTSADSETIRKSRILKILLTLSRLLRAVADATALFLYNFLVHFSVSNDIIFF